MFRLTHDCNSGIVVFSINNQGQSGLQFIPNHGKVLNGRNAANEVSKVIEPSTWPAFADKFKKNLSNPNQERLFHDQQR